jgi:hypothetical protein
MKALPAFKFESVNSDIQQKNHAGAHPSALPSLSTGSTASQTIHAAVSLGTHGSG